jgi:hypothetical protein
MKFKSKAEAAFGYLAYYLRPTQLKIGIGIALVGLSLASVETVKFTRGVSRWETSLTNGTNSTVYSDKVTRFESDNSQGVSLYEPFVYGGIGAIAALVGGVIAGTANRDTSYMLRRERNIRSLADREAIKRRDYTN